MFLYCSDKSPKAEAPSFLKRIGDTEVYEGMKAKFTACATGYPEPEVEWFRNGDRVYSTDRTKIDVEPNGNYFVLSIMILIKKNCLCLGLLRLTISDVNQGDVGKYTCRVFNPHGEDSCVADLVYDSRFLESIEKKEDNLKNLICFCSI